jgi:hypothetical protein
VKIVITSQPAPLLTSADDIVRQSLALDGTDKDDLVDGLLLAAQAELDGPLGWVGISVAEQSVEVRVDDFVCPIRLPGGPILDHIIVTYLASADGSVTTLDESGYALLTDGTLQLASGQTWPALYSQGEAVRIAYDVGIEDPDDPRIRLMKTAIIMHAKMTLDFDDPDTRRRTIESLVRSMWVPVL